MNDWVFGPLKIEHPLDPIPVADMAEGPVKITAGRYHGKKGDLLWSREFPTPSGSTVTVVGVRITLKKEPVIVTLFAHEVEAA